MNQRRAVVGLFLATVVALPLAGCGLESQDETSREHTQNQAADFEVGGMQVRNAFLTFATSVPSPPPAAVGSVAPLGTSASPTSGGSIPGGSPSTTGYLVVTFVNDGAGADALTGVQTPGATVTLGGSAANTGSLSLPKGVVVTVGSPALGSTGGPTLSFPVTGTPAPVGTAVPFRFTFANAGTSATIKVPVVSGGVTTQVTQAVPSATPLTPAAAGEPAND